MKAALKFFSIKQREIINLLLQGKSKKDIALELNISPNTLKSHIARIKAILKMGNEKLVPGSLAIHSPNVIIIEDDIMLLRALEFTLARAGCTTFIAENANQAISIIKESELDLVICDLFLPHISGFSLIAALKELYEDELPIIVISSPRNKAMLDMMNLGNLDFIPKPIHMPALLDKVKRYNKLRFTSMNLGTLESNNEMES